jgi:hypothetical protein
LDTIKWASKAGLAILFGIGWNGLEATSTMGFCLSWEVSDQKGLCLEAVYRALTCGKLLNMVERIEK